MTMKTIKFYWYAYKEQRKIIESCTNLSKDKLYQIIKLITLYADNGFAHLSVKRIRTEIAEKDHKQYLTFLIENKLILVDNDYSSKDGESFTRGYKFFPRKYTKIERITGADQSFIKSVIKKINKATKANNSNKKKEDFIIDMRKKCKAFISSLDVSKIKSISSTLKKGESPEKTLKRMYSIEKIDSFQNGNSNEFHFSRSKTNGRIDSNLTNLKSTYKNYNNYTDNLVNIDIVNSQPYLLYLVLNILVNFPSTYHNDAILGNSTYLIPLLTKVLSRVDKSPLFQIMLGGIKPLEMDKFRDYVSSDFYEKFSIDLYGNYDQNNRKELKKIIFNVLFSKPGFMNSTKKKFKELFPGIFLIIENMKRKDSILDFVKTTGKGKSHGRLAIFLQKFESSLNIDCVCSKLYDRGIVPITIHDSWIVEEYNIAKAKEVIFDCYSFAPVAPNLNVEKLQPTNKSEYVLDMKNVFDHMYSDDGLKMRYVNMFTYEEMGEFDNINQLRDHFVTVDAPRLAHTLTADTYSYVVKELNRVLPI